MKRLLIALLLFSPLTARALDPFTAAEYKDKGMIVVEAPLADNSVTITNAATGASQTITPSSVNWVAPGSYNVTIKMQDYTFNQTAIVNATERTDVKATGYGALKVNTPSPTDMVEVVPVGGANPVAKFASAQAKVVPTGTYDVKIHVGSNTLTQNNIMIVTNTTRQIDVLY